MNTLKSLLGSSSYSALLLRARDGEGGGAGDGGDQGGDPPADGGAEGGEGGEGSDDGAEGGEGGEGGAAAGATEGAESGEGEGEGDGDPPPAQPDWKTRELSRKHRQIQEKNRKIADQEQELRDLRAIAEGRTAAAAAPKAGDPPAAERRPAANNDADLETRAQQIAAQNQFNKDCNHTAEEGKKQYKEKWDAAAATLAQLGGFDADTMVGILATDDPAKVLFELGSNPDEYHRLIDLPPARRQTEFVKIAIKPKKAVTPRSKAPAPTDPVRGRNQGDPTELKDDQDDDTWFKRRREAKQKKWQAEQSRR